MLRQFEKYLADNKIELTEYQRGLAYEILTAKYIDILVPRGSGKTFLFNLLDRFLSSR